MVEEDLSVYCLKYAESMLSESMVFVGGSPEKQIPISFVVYLIKTNNRNILVDAGCNTMPGFDMKKFYSPAFALRRLGLSASNITDVIITHAHHDHIEAVKYYKNAVIYISKSEYENGKKYICDDLKVSTFENEYRITSQVRVIEIGGHSKGSSIIEITTKKGLYIIAGDECYTNTNIEKKICTGAYICKEKSIQFIEKYSDKKYNVHTCHDISLKTERVI